MRREDALDVMAGWVIVNDLTLREQVWRPDLPELGTDFLASKNAPTFLPTGPVLVPRAAVPDPSDLHVTLRLNGEVMQDQSTNDMIFDVAEIIAHCSNVATLLPGDLVLTGSPAGNGLAHGRLLRPGDRMDATITRARRTVHSVRSRTVGERLMTYRPPYGGLRAATPVTSPGCRYRAR